MQQDVSRYLDRLAGRDLLDELAFRPVRPATLRLREYQLRQFASALVQRGRDPASLTCLHDIVEPSAFKEGLRYLLERRGGKSTRTVVDIATALKAVARHHVQVDAQHLAGMAAVIGRLHTPSGGLTSRNRARLRPLDDPQIALALVQLPAKLLALAEREPRPKRAARLAQTAVMIEILLMAPLRISNLASLDIERHLVRPSRSGQAVHIVIEGSEVKNAQPLEFPLPPQSVALLERYLTAFRPTLAADGGTALFPGRTATFASTAIPCASRSRTRYSHTPASECIRTCSGTSPRSCTSTPTQEPTRWCAGCWGIARSTRRPGSTAAWKRLPPSATSTQPFSSCAKASAADDSAHLDPDRRSMPLSEWPRADRELWQAALVPGDLLEEGGARTRYAAAPTR